MVAKDARSKSGNGADNPSSKSSERTLRLGSNDFFHAIAEHGLNGSTMSQILKFSTVMDLLHTERNKLAILPIDERKPLFHSQLKIIMENDFPKALSAMGVKPGSRIGLVLPNGPEMAVCVMSCTYCIACAPVNIQNTLEEIISELRSAKADWVIVSDKDLASKLNESGFHSIELIPSETVSGFFTLRRMGSPSLTYTVTGYPPSIRDARIEPSASVVALPPLRRDQTALVLHTSGTSGKKKVVGYTVETLAIGAALVVASWELRPDDIGLNMMPLFHVGGIVRNLMAPLMSGGATIPCRAFDATQFWDLAEETGATWYYAAPTMHHMILEEGRHRLDATVSIRMVCNAAGGLLPALAKDLQYRFGGAAILPSYGMTECMPIASPPADYVLDRPGTSGKVVGPELQIFDGKGKALPAGQVGNIVVRGPPCFSGYEGDVAATEDSMFPGGWFNTGDMGYLDGDGYLFITGRSKEVINRGGEIISPFEIEQAVIGHPGIKETLAFSVPHHVLQEAVGVVLVSEPGHPRVDLQELQKFLGDSLHPSKWPILAVYMDALPISAANKVLRVKLADRLGLQDVDDALPQIDRLYTATCPLKGSPLTLRIPSAPVDVKAELAATRDVIVRAAGIDRMDDAGLVTHKTSIVLYLMPKKNSDWTPAESLALHRKLDSCIHAYLRPKSLVAVPHNGSGFLPRLPDGSLDISKLPAPPRPRKPPAAATSSMETAVMEAWAQILNLPVEDFSSDSDFFHMGGTSLAAGRMVAILRKKVNVPLTAGTVFQHRTVVEFGKYLEGLLNEKQAASQMPARPAGEFSVEGEEMESGFAHLLDDNEAHVAECAPRDSASFAALIIQILPLVIFYPVSRISLWFLFTFYLSLLRILFNSAVHVDGVNLVNAIGELVAAIVMVKLSADVIMPLTAIACKWIIIGRFKAGRYPLWGHYYLRWFLVQQILRIGHIGMFTWFPDGKIWYYRLLGAKIGRNVLLNNHAKLGEYDLVSIGDNTWVDNADVRPFCLDRGTMLLREIRIGEDCVVCQKTAIVPGTSMPNGTVLPPCSSSYEMTDSDPKYRDFCRVGFPIPALRWRVLIGYPILFYGTFFKLLPWICALYLYVSIPAFSTARTQADVILWFGSPARLPLFCFMKVVKDCVSPFIYLVYVIVIKRLVIGRFKAGARERSQWNLMRSWLMKKLMPGRDLGGVAGLIGPNFGVISFIYRLLGAKVGKHVYWPGSGVYIEEFDLLDVGDHVVFGSRSEIVCTDARESAPVKLGAGCMVADRCVLLPGVTIGKGATLGSGTLAAKGSIFPAGSTWVGSQKGCATLWDLGNEKEAEAASSETPYARAMSGKANYFVLPIWGHAVFNYIWAIFVSSFHTIPIIIVLGVTVVVGQPWLTKESTSREMLTIYGIMLGLAVASVIIIAISTLLIVIAFKWIVIGLRKEGSFNWDESSYNQRWQIMRRIETLRSNGVGGKGVLNFLTGSEYLVWYFRALGANIGKNVCLYPNSGDPMMTEPELVTLEDEAAVDEASLVAHINTKGVFALNRLRVGRGATLRSQSRLLSGAAMEEHSMLLEHTLVLSGDCVDAHSIWQGWPARMVAAPPSPPEDSVELFAGH